MYCKNSGIQHEGFPDVRSFPNVSTKNVTQENSPPFKAGQAWQIVLLVSLSGHLHSSRIDFRPFDLDYSGSVFMVWSMEQERLEGLMDEWMTNSWKEWGRGQNGQLMWAFFSNRSYFLIELWGVTQKRTLTLVAFFLHIGNA